MNVKIAAGERFLTAIYRGDVPHIRWVTRKIDGKKVDFLHDTDAQMELFKWFNDNFKNKDE